MGRITGSWLGGHEVSVSAGSLESSSPLSVVRDGSSPMSLKSDGVTEFIDEDGVSLRGWIGEDLEVCRPDARVEPTVGVANVTIAQHTEGRGESATPCLIFQFLVLTVLWRVLVVGWVCMVLPMQE